MSCLTPIWFYVTFFYLYFTGIGCLWRSQKRIRVRPDFPMETIHNFVLPGIILKSCLFEKVQDASGSNSHIDVQTAEAIVDVFHFLVKEWGQHPVDSAILVQGDDAVFHDR